MRFIKFESINATLKSTSKSSFILRDTLFKEICSVKPYIVSVGPTHAATLDDRRGGQTTNESD